MYSIIWYLGIMVDNGDVQEYGVHGGYHPEHTEVHNVFYLPPTTILMHLQDYGMYRVSGINGLWDLQHYGDVPDYGGYGGYHDVGIMVYMRYRVSGISGLWCRWWVAS